MEQVKSTALTLITGVCANTQGKRIYQSREIYWGSSARKIGHTWIGRVLSTCAIIAGRGCRQVVPGAGEMLPPDTFMRCLKHPEAKRPSTYPAILI